MPVDGVDVVLLVERLGTDGAPARGEDVEREHLRGALRRLGAQHREAALDGVLGQRGAALEQVEKLPEELRDELGLLGGAGDRDLVAADVHVAREGVLHDVEQLVPGTEQGDHRMVVRNHDLDLRARALVSGVGGMR